MDPRITSGLVKLILTRLWSLHSLMLNTAYVTLSFTRRSFYSLFHAKLDTSEMSMLIRTE